ncbi:phosphatase PAP2 family protein [Natronorubrum texcoconense]|uniref:Membrane-associated phospholipid phosphatase n=1 Tax=Natronorubrum texcoconense TaxID=1095776 RepID=A0A1G9DQU4_9EURY|nr:phosphatase PAP2 family protein [Natronorubrum texcoconense]SDK66238.1 Membrane-associated phospholipid phosphatase [Natronorubrum texcoconense]
MLSQIALDRSVGVTEYIRDVLPEWSVQLFELAALLGDELVVVGVLLVFVTADVYRSVRRGSDRLVSDRVAFVSAVVLGGLALTLVVKTTLGFPRPPESLQAVPREGDGFPSGHTMAATVLWGALALWGARFTGRQRFGLAAVLVGLVGFSRLALGVHYLVDVLASVGLGIGYLVLAAAVTGREPRLAFAGAAVLGGVAVLSTGGDADGWLAFVGCVGGAVGWWLTTLPSVRAAWQSVT